VTLVVQEQSVEDSDGESPQNEAPDAAVAQAKRRVSWKRVTAQGVLPTLALLLAAGAGYLKWVDGSAREAQTASAESVRVAVESTIAMRPTYRELQRLLQLTDPRCGDPRRQAETNFRNGQRSGCGIGLRIGEPCCGACIRQPIHHDRQRCSNEHCVQRSRHPRQGPEPMAHIAIRSSMRPAIVTLSRGQLYPQLIADVMADFRTSQEYQVSYLSNQAVNELCPALIWQLRNSAAHDEAAQPISH
jgi:hypothetical protein